MKHTVYLQGLSTYDDIRVLFKTFLKQLLRLCVIQSPWMDIKCMRIDLAVYATDGVMVAFEPN